MRIFLIIIFLINWTFKCEIRSFKTTKYYEIFKLRLNREINYANHGKKLENLCFRQLLQSEE